MSTAGTGATPDLPNFPSLDDILALLANGVRLTAKKIATLLDATKTRVNDLLWHAPTGLVSKDPTTHEWSLCMPPAPPPNAPPVAPTQANAPTPTQPNAPPNCPLCGLLMRQRTARTGPTSGSLFWGCSSYPRCTGTLNMVEAPHPQASGDPSSSAAAAIARAIDWRESKGRSSWDAEYVPIGANSNLFADAIFETPAAVRLLNQTVFLQLHSNIDRPANPTATGLLAIIEKILMRGRLPLPCLEVEAQALQTHGLANDVADLGLDDIELGWEWRTAPEDWTMDALLEREPFTSCSELNSVPGSNNSVLDSIHEQEFIALVGREDPTLPHWLMPQVLLGKLAPTSAGSEKDNRRVDFVFCHPHISPPIVIEIDGPEHEFLTDKARDEQLSHNGLEVLRIPNAQVVAGHGPQLDKALARIKSAIGIRVNRSSRAWRSGQFSLECAWGAKFQLAIIKAVQTGLLPVACDQWRIRISSPFDSSLAALKDLLQLLDSVCQIYGEIICPPEVIVELVAGSRKLLKSVDNHWLDTPYDLPLPTPPHATIYLEPTIGPYGAYPTENVDLIVRPAFLTQDLAPMHSRGTNQVLNATNDFSGSQVGLTHVLRAVFRKQAFREGQAQAVHHALRGSDSIILLPTGGGKSIIYQLSGLLSPGITLVIDPLVSLIEDQIRGLQVYGIDRAVGFSSSSGDRAERALQLDAAQRGYFLFILVAPERMQSPQFRRSLLTITHIARINLAVVDEAHCVSEWGHDFRPAYLNLARNLRGLNKPTPHPPTIIALTGTASRAVLRDMVADLELDTHTQIPIVRPASFDRSEIEFRIMEVTPSNVDATLEGVLHALPRDFNRSHGVFYTPAGRRTHCGIVFTPFVKPARGGILDYQHRINSQTGTTVTIYSGSAPLPALAAQWDITKRKNAKLFMTNKVAILVATKAFGMGIDKPNVRYTIHAGMPGSLEAFYQEAGRAGRDRKPAISIVLFCRPDPEFEPALALLDATYHTALESYEKTPRYERGDIGTALYFHFKAFKGKEDEIQAVRESLTQVGMLVPNQTKKLPLQQDGDKKKREEKALFRLVQAGILADYEIEHYSSVIEVFGGTTNPQSIADRIAAYVARTDRARVPAIQVTLSQLRTAAYSIELGTKLCEVLIEFCYDTIEQARRRSIFEAMEAAKQGINPAQFRRRLLDYLQEGMDPDTLQRLVTAESIDFPACLEIVAKLNSSVEAGELRGTTIRFLESYPAHPLLLLLRAVSESLCEDCDDSVVTSSLDSLFASASSKYSVDATGLDSAVATIATIAANQAAPQSTILFASLLLASSDAEYRADDTALRFDELAERAMALNNEKLEVVILCIRLQTAVSKLQATVNSAGFIPN